MDAAKEQASRVEEEAASWNIPDLATLETASVEELPIIDLAALRNGQEGAVEELATKLMGVFNSTGFFLVANHGCEEEVAATLAMSRRYHTDLSTGTKERVPFGERGVGYLRINQRVLPKRAKGNMNASFIVKHEPGPRNIQIADNPFPPEEALPGFREQVMRYASSMKSLALSLLPVFATALDLPCNYFTTAFTDPMFRLRLSHYPPADPTSRVILKSVTLM